MGNARIIASALAVAALAGATPAAHAAGSCARKDFVIYFAFNAAELNADAHSRIRAEAASINDSGCAVAGIVIKGHTDTSGSNRVNHDLSHRRARVVAEALIAAGLPRERIATEGLGETDLARATRDGSREPLNRRAAVTVELR